MNRVNLLMCFVCLCLLAGCSESADLKSAEPVGGESVAVTAALRVQLLPMAEASSSATRSASDKREQGEAVHVSYGSNAATRVQTGTSDMTAGELKISNAYILQFGGTSAGSVLNAKVTLSEAQLKSGSAITCNFNMVSGVKNRVYVVANVPSTKTLTVGTTTLGDFEAPVTQAPFSSVPTSGLPMSACQDVGVGDSFDTFRVHSLLAKLTFTCKTSGATMKLKGLPAGYTFCTQAASGSPVRPTGMTYTATAALTSGTTYYVPENLSGRNDLLIKHVTRALGMAPTNAMYVELTNGSVVYNVLLGDGTPSDFNVVGNEAYYVTATITGTDAYDLRVGNPAGLSSITDLNGDGQTANCYIVTSANSWYMFNNTVMGNGATTPLPADLNTSKSVAAPIVPENLNPVDADVLWETLNTTVSPAKGDVVTAYPLKDRILFKSGAKEGNAVIAARDASNNIIWSWHIWRTNTTPASQPLAAITGFAAAGELVIMDRNLGALSVAAQNDLSTGLHYQWGRKDPMPAYAGLATSSTVMATQPAGIPSIVTGNNSKTPADVVKYPTTFYTSNGGNHDWASRNDNLWGTPLTVISGSFTTNKGSKTIYDPCPPGWRVPPSYAFKNASTSNGGAYNVGYSFGSGFLSSGSSWFPASGYRSSGNGGALFGVGANGTYWMATPVAYNPTFGSYLYFGSNFVDPADDSGRASAYSCRCAKE